MRVEDFVKYEEGCTNVPYTFICKTLHWTKKKSSRFHSGIVICSSSSTIVTCNLNSNVHVAMLQTCKFAPLICAYHFQLVLLSPCLANNCEYGPIDNGLTFHWLQMTCARVNKGSTWRACTFPMERDTQDFACHLRCLDHGNNRGANVELLWNYYTWNHQWQKPHTIGWNMWTSSVFLPHGY